MTTQCLPGQQPYLTPDLIPPDYNRCQCVITAAHGPFRFGPKPIPEQCWATPSVLLLQITPDHDGERGAMCVCVSCLAQFKLHDRRDVRILQIRGRRQ